jgi:CSLREA domain-containing protein
LGIALQPIYATTIIVNTVADHTTNDAFCTLPEAILTANGTPANGNCGIGAAGLDTIAFNLSAGTPSITLSNPLANITQLVIIKGLQVGQRELKFWEIS